MKNFFAEFKKFITRGNVLDMSVGVIVGGAFTAIVNGMSNFILKPIINWILALILGKGSLSEIYTFLGKPVYTVDEAGKEVIDLANSIYIDWGAFINAIINFLLIAAAGINRRDKAAVEAYFAEKERIAAEEAAKAQAEAEEAARLEREANPTAEDLLKKIIVLLENK